MKLKATLLMGTALVLNALPAAGQVHVDRRFPMQSDGYIRIQNLTGTVTVAGWDRDSVVVTGTVYEPRDEPFFLGRVPDGAKFGVWSNDATDLPPSTFDVHVPAGARVWIRTASADVVVAGVTGSVDINSVTGAIRVRGNPGELFVETLAGRIDVDADARTVRARTASGAITVRGGIRDVVATSVSGDLEIAGDRFERGSFESVDGDIRYFGNVGHGSALDFTDHSGTIEFALPPGASGDFVVGTFYGEFDNRIGVRTTESGSKVRGTEYRFTLGSGGGQITVRNFKGRVVLRSKG